MASTSSPKVNKPIDPKQKEADVNRKLQFYGIATAFQNGKVPSNEQIDVALNSFLASRALSRPSKNLSSEGRALVADVQEVVKQAKNLVLSKNEGNLLQDFIYQTTHFDAKSVSTPDAPVTKEIAKQHGDKALEGLRTLGTLIITNGQFRKLLKDFGFLLRDVAGDAASEAAGKLRPSGEAMAQLDSPADNNVWHDAPDMSKASIKSRLKDASHAVYKGNPKEDVRVAKDVGVSTAHPTGSADPRDLAGAGAHEAQTGATTGIDTEGGARGAAGTLQQRVNENVSDDTKETARAKKAELQARTKEYMKKKMPEERREQTIWRLKKMVIECQQHPDYQTAISTLLDLAEEYGSHANRLGQQSTGTVKQTRDGLAQAEGDLKTLIERFANGTSSEDLWDSIGVIYKDADNDPELKNWFKAMNNYIRRCLQEQGYILDDHSTQEWNHLYDHGNYLLRNKYKPHTDRIVEEIKFMADQFDQDPHNKAFANSLTKLFNDLGNDENGKPTFKKHLVKDLTDVILPAIFENVAYIPVPRIEYSDPQIDAVIENLVLESDNFMPNVFEIASENFVRWGRKKIANKNKHSAEIKVAGIQMDLRDLSYYVKRKQGFPSITDTGVANILLPGDGFTFKIKVSSADPKDSQNFFKVDKVDVDIKNLKIDLVRSNHKLLFGMFKPIMLRVLRPALKKALGKAIKDNFNKFDTMLHRIKVEADRAKSEARDDPTQVPNIYQRYYNAVQKKALEGRRKVEDKVADKKVNYAVTKEDSIFPSIHLPGGISSKATEYRDLGRKGDKWESPVFSIGSAAKSTNVAPAPKIVRKPHNVTDPHRTPAVGGLGGAGLNGTPATYQAGQAGGYGGRAVPNVAGVNGANLGNNPPPHFT